MLLLPWLAVGVVVVVVSWLKFGLEDPRVVGVFPFYWPGGTRNPDGSITGGAGISDLPNCAATYQAMGRLIKAAAPGGTSGDIAHNPPKGAAAAGPEPKCPTPARSPPGTWEWCSRSKGNGGFACNPKTKQCSRDLAGVYETLGECTTKCA